MSRESVAYTGQVSLAQRLRRGAENAIDLTGGGGGGSGSASSSSSSSSSSSDRIARSKKRASSAISASSSSSSSSSSSRPPARRAKQEGADPVYSTTGGKRSKHALHTSNAGASQSLADYSTIFASGGFKNVYLGVYTESEGGARDGEKTVHKRFKTGNVLTDFHFDDDMIAMRRAKDLIHAFNHEMRFTNVATVHMNEASVWTQISPPHYKSLVEPLIEGRFIKFNSNTGYTNGDSLMDALSHYSYHATAGKELLCDVQGGKYERSYVLTDPIIMSRDRKYGPTDLGLDGMSTFFSQHRCSKHCRY